MYQLTFYVPDSHLEQVKDAIFSAGAGHYNDYDRCAWQTAGQSQFRPLPGSTPFLGQTHQLQCVDEYKVETIVEEHCIGEVMAALIAAHPYQQPAYAVIRILTREDFPR